MTKEFGNGNSNVEPVARAIGESSHSSVSLSIKELTGQANAFLEKNELREAYPYICRLAEDDSAAPQVGVTAGLVALTLGRKEEAAKHFRCVREKTPDNYDACYNLALLEIGDGNYDEAAELLQVQAERRPDDATLHNDLAILWMNKSDIPRTLQSFEKALRLDPNFGKARENAMQFTLQNNLLAEGRRLLGINAIQPQLTDASAADIERWRRLLDRSASDTNFATAGETNSLPMPAIVKAPLKDKKIALFASRQTFAKDIIRRLSEQNEIRTFSGRSAQEMADLMKWADVVWFEWCDALIIEATRHAKQCCIVCRLHSYEVFTDMPSKVDWSKVDRLVFVNRSVEEIFRRQVRTEVPVAIIHNGVDLDRFRIADNKEYGKRIASVGYINYKKNPALLLYCFKKIHAYDPEYSLHIAGQHQDPRLQVYFEHFLRHNPLPVYFHGWIDDMPAWYADKDFVISTSLFESFHYSIAEGMASGLMPLIHDWYGAGGVYPREFLFTDADDCLNLLKRLEKADKHRLAQENRHFIAGRYNQEDKYDQIEKLLASLTGHTPVKIETPVERGL